MTNFGGVWTPRVKPDPKRFRGVWSTEVTSEVADPADLRTLIDEATVVVTDSRDWLARLGELAPQLRALPGPDGWAGELEAMAVGLRAAGGETDDLAALERAWSGMPTRAAAQMLEEVPWWDERGTNLAVAANIPPLEFLAANRGALAGGLAFARELAATDLPTHDRVRAEQLGHALRYGEWVRHVFLGALTRPTALADLEVQLADIRRHLNWSGPKYQQERREFAIRTRELCADWPQTLPEHAVITSSHPPPPPRPASRSTKGREIKRVFSALLGDQPSIEPEPEVLAVVPRTASGFLAGQPRAKDDQVVAVRPDDQRIGVHTSVLLPDIIAAYEAAIAAVDGERQAASDEILEALRESYTLLRQAVDRPEEAATWIAEACARYAGVDAARRQSVLQALSKWAERQGQRRHDAPDFLTQSARLWIAQLCDAQLDYHAGAGGMAHEAAERIEVLTACAALARPDEAADARAFGRAAGYFSQTTEMDEITAALVRRFGPADRTLTVRPTWSGKLSQTPPGHTPIQHPTPGAA